MNEFRNKLNKNISLFASNYGHVLLGCGSIYFAFKLLLSIVKIKTVGWPDFLLFFALVLFPLGTWRKVAFEKNGTLIIILFYVAPWVLVSALFAAKLLTV